MNWKRDYTRDRGVLIQAVTMYSVWTLCTRRASWLPPCCAWLPRGHSWCPAILPSWLHGRPFTTGCTKYFNSQEKGFEGTWKSSIKQATTTTYEHNPEYVQMCDKKDSSDTLWNWRNVFYSKNGWKKKVTDSIHLLRQNSWTLARWDIAS